MAAANAAGTKSLDKRISHFSLNRIDSDIFSPGREEPHPLALCIRNYNANNKFAICNNQLEEDFPKRIGLWQKKDDKAKLQASCFPVRLAARSTPNSLTNKGIKLPPLLADEVWIGKCQEADVIFVDLRLRKR